MRLQILNSGHQPAQKEKFKVIEARFGRVPDPILTLSYRPELFGRYFAACYHQAMRASSQWRIGEVELFAAFVSKLNKCLF